MEESLVFIERRRYPRSFFTQEERVIGSFILLENEPEGRKAMILNMSRGGFGFTLPKTQKKGIRKGTRLLLYQIQARDSKTKVETDLTLEIRWVLDHGYLDHIGFGCEYKNPQEGAIQNLVDFFNNVFPGRID